MAEYCEYMWDPTRGHGSTALARSIYDEQARFDKRDKKLAIKTVRAILQEMPNVDLKHCTDEYITRFLLARKYRTEQAADLIVAYQFQITHRQDIFGNLTARDPALQRALRAGIPGVLPARDRKGRCVLVILASQWDPIAVPALSVQRAIFLVLETLIQDPRNQQSGFVAVVDWSGFSLRQGGALGAAAVRNLINALRGRFPARFKAIHFLSAPLYVQATLALVKPFLDEKTRNKIYLHGNNLSTLHEHLPTDILPAELGGTGPAFNPGLWAEPVIHSAMKEAELAATTTKKGKEHVDADTRIQEPADLRNDGLETANGNCEKSDGSNISAKLRDNVAKTALNNSGSPAARHSTGRASAQVDVELNVINRRMSSQKETTESVAKNDEDDDDVRDRLVRVEQISNNNVDEIRRCSEDRTSQHGDTDESAFLDVESEINSNEFEIIPSRSASENSSLDNRSSKAFIVTSNTEIPSEKTNLIT